MKQAEIEVGGVYAREVAGETYQRVVTDIKGQSVLYRYVEGIRCITTLASFARWAQRRVK